MTHDQVNKLDPRIADLLKKYIAPYVIYGDSALKDLSLEDQRILKIVIKKNIKIKRPKADKTLDLFLKE